MHDFSLSYGFKVGRKLQTQSQPPSPPKRPMKEKNNICIIYNFSMIWPSLFVSWYLNIPRPSFPTLLVTHIILTCFSYWWDHRFSIRRAQRTGSLKNVSRSDSVLIQPCFPPRKTASARWLRSSIWNCSSWQSRRSAPPVQKPRLTPRNWHLFNHHYNGHSLEKNLQSPWRRG